MKMLKEVEAYWTRRAESYSDVVCHELNHSNEKSWMEKDEICKLETNIDDCSGEALGFLMERLMQVGAKDVLDFSPLAWQKEGMM